MFDFLAFNFDGYLYVCKNLRKDCMKVLFSTLYGSRLYGTNTPESDRDEKLVVLPTLDSLLLGRAPKNSTKGPKKELGQKNGADDEDVERISLQVFAQHFIEGQTYALELAWAVDYHKAEQEVFDPRFVDFCHELRARFMTKNCNAIIGYAVNQANIYSNKGERLNTLRAANGLFAEFVKRGDGKSRVSDCTTEFEQLAKPIAEQFPLYFQLTEYPIDAEGITMRPCVKLLEKTLPYSSTFENNLAVVQAALNRYGSRANSASVDNVDWKAMMHAVRIVQEGLTLFQKSDSDRLGYLEFPYFPDYCAWLLSIKRGELDVETVRNLLTDGVDELKRVTAESSYPELNKELQLEFNEWLLGWLKKFYFVEQPY